MEQDSLHGVVAFIGGQDPAAYGKSSSWFRKTGKQVWAEMLDAWNRLALELSGNNDGLFDRGGVLICCPSTGGVNS